jgi:saccharopine dehydrogenase-like NADP-dependent oxidoreductase
MMNVVVLGAGGVGTTIAQMLADSGDYQVVLADHDERALTRVTGPFLKQQVDARDPFALRALLARRDAVINALPFSFVENVARAAHDSHAHYFDLTEDVAATRTVKGLAAESTTAFVPQCGLAPGFIAIAAHDLVQRFEKATDLHMRVGALPVYPTNALKYNLTWCTESLINEYCNPCEVILDGIRREVLPLEGLETFSLDGTTYEAFNTSGGLGSLCETLEGQIANVDYKTVRYPGHRDVMKLLLQDLGLGRRRELLKEVLEAAVPVTVQDVVLIFVTATGFRAGRLIQESLAKKIYSREIGGVMRSAIQVTTAAGMCALVDLVRSQALPQRGLVRQEHVPLPAFLANRFGKYYQ